MNFNEFQKILDEDIKKPYGEERMDVVLDFEPAVYYDKLLNTYWYYDEDDEVLKEVGYTPEEIKALRDKHIVCK